MYLFTVLAFVLQIKKNISQKSENNYNYTIFYIVILSYVKSYRAISKHKYRVTCNFFCKVISNINSTGLWVTLLPEVKFQSLCLFKHKSKEKSKENAIIMKHAVKTMKEKGVHLEASNCECKLLKGNFWRKIYRNTCIYLCTQSPSEYADT